MPNHFHGIISLVGAIHELPHHSHFGSLPTASAIHGLPLYPHLEQYRAVREPGMGAVREPGMGAVREPPLQNTYIRRNMIIPKMIGYFKMNSAKNINEYFQTPGKRVWQRNYYERIIRNTRELHNTRTYIKNNPLRG